MTTSGDSCGEFQAPGAAKKRPALPRRNGELKQLEREAKASFVLRYVWEGLGFRGFGV